MSTDTYADWLRARDDDGLRALFAARPELITPVPADMGALAARASAASAVSRALDRLDRLALNIFEALLVLPSPTAYDDLLAAVAAEPSARARIRDAVDRLRSLALVWGEDDALRVVPGGRQVIPHPAGLGPPLREAFASYSSDRLAELLDDLGLESVDDIPARIGALVEDAGPEARAALDRLAWGPPVGRVDGARRPVTLATASSPIEHLLARGLLAATDDRTVTLPREVGLHLRGGRVFAELRTTPPPLGGTARSARLVDRTAGGQAFTFVRSAEELLDRWGIDPPGVLRGGGLGIRDLRSTATELDVPEWTAALLIEVAYAAGLLARDGDHDGPAGARWLPTPAFDLWRLRDVERRWADLATAWLVTDRAPGLAGERDDRERLINALSDEAVRVSSPQVRRSVLGALADAKPGTAPGADEVFAYLTWQQPRRGGTLRERLVRWTLREAETLGVTGLGALSGHARGLLSGGDTAKALASVLPEPVDHVLIQADLTAVAPGPLVSDLARELALAADVESTGGATVYRFTPGSVRRALDAGRGASELIDLLKRHSATDLPQPLTYLIEDVARRHGRLRVGVASAYIRSDDPAVLDEILADRRSEQLRLHRLAPTVLASRASRGELLESLRALGYAPVAESPEGSVVITRLDARRSETTHGTYEPAHHSQVAVAGPDASVVTAAVRALRAGERAARATAPEGAPPRSPAMAMVKQLRQAADRGSRVWIGYLDQQGQASSRIIEPARVEGGFLTAYDATRAAVQRFALHRITGVADVDGSS
ncbi:helicase C-terminal domain-containing protein [Actinoallomurus purpureus]|uniref:helicase-associated domain-containing protein n=1 Tax=Actinoallomurus purpureus TaxID=478114 RepID=UPI002092B2DB|nr:helicase-associated domain-containing protein [Actinoallomurus purpureus]MCO6010918.1 helicase C-terminal domain-containing protein [Actinoallomurus purpureus]